MDQRWAVMPIAEGILGSLEQLGDIFHAMKLDSANAHPMGSLIHDGTHTPFHALACPLNPRMVRIGKKR